MPDIGGFGRGLLKGALTATEKAAEKVKDAAEAASRKMTSDDDPDATQIVKSTADPDTTQVVTEAEEDPDATQVIRGSSISQADASGQFSRAPGRPPTVTRPAGPRPPRTAPPHAPATPGSSAPRGFPPSGGSLPQPAGPFPGPTGGPTPPPRLDAPPFADPASSGEPSLADEADDHADASDVRELVDMFQALLAIRRPPPGPIQGEWSTGIGDLLGEHPKVPERVRGLVSRLNRFGGVALSPREVVFDGDDVPWEKVTEVRTRHVVDYLVGEAVQQQVENLPMPWFPGCRRLLDALGQAILTVTIATARNQLEKLEYDLRIPAEISYKASFGRTKELNAGVLSALVLADPAVNQSLIATARARGITVTAGEDELLANADERADKIREKVAALEVELERFTTRFGRKD